MNTSVPVLVVDDSHTMSLIITSSLQKLGFTDIDLARDGKSALDRLRDKEYGLVLSDWEMQPMSGNEFLKEKGQDQTLRNIPVILISSKSGRGASWLAGANAHLSKPFTQGNLEAAIKTALRH